MATYILRCTMQLGTSPASLSVKCLQNRSGVRFAQPFLVGLRHGFFPRTPHNQEPQRGIGPHCGSLTFVSDLCDLIVVEAQILEAWCCDRRLWRLWLASGHGFWRSFFSFSFSVSFLLLHSLRLCAYSH